MISVQITRKQVSIYFFVLLAILAIYEAIEPLLGLQVYWLLEATVPFVIVTLIVGVKRLITIGKSPVLAVLSLVPFVNYLFLIYLCIARSNDEPVNPSGISPMGRIEYAIYMLMFIGSFCYLSYKCTPLFAAYDESFVLGDLAPVPTIKLYWYIVLYRASVLFFSTLFAVKILVKRLADAGKSIYYAWFMAIPVFGFIFSIYMCFVKTHNRNIPAQEE